VIQVSFEHWPVVVFTLSGKVTIEDVALLARRSDEALGREAKHVNIFDCRSVIERPGAVIRQKLAEYAEASGPMSARFALGSAIIVRNAVLRGVMTAIHWVAKPTIPVETVGSFQEATETCRGWLSAARISPAPDAWEKLKSFGLTSS
jgi:hypothetical protein